MPKEAVPHPRLLPMCENALGHALASHGNWQPCPAQNCHPTCQECACAEILDCWHFWLRATWQRKDRMPLFVKTQSTLAICRLIQYIRKTYNRTKLVPLRSSDTSMLKFSPDSQFAQVEELQGTIREKIWIYARSLEKFYRKTWKICRGFKKFLYQSKHAVSCFKRLIYLRDTVRERGRNREIFPYTGLFPCPTESRARLKPGGCSWPHTRWQGPPNTWAILYCFSQAISRHWDHSGAAETWTGFTQTQTSATLGFPVPMPTIAGLGHV